MVKSKRAREAVDLAEQHPTVEEVPTKKRKVKADNSNGDDEAQSEKARKEKKDEKRKKKHEKESRREKKLKRKDLQDLPEQDEVENTEEKSTAEADLGGKVKKEKKERKEKKEKGKPNSAEENMAQPTVGTITKPKKSKKSKPGTTNGENSHGVNGSVSANTGPSQEDGKDCLDNGNPIDLPLREASSKANDAEGQEIEKADRHIVFVGNLPFSATAASISAHFASLSPIAVRCMRNRDDPNPCRGIAFVEFGKVWHMRTCLDKFHHSMFDDKISSARKINIELT